MRTLKHLRTGATILSAALWATACGQSHQSSHKLTAHSSPKIGVLLASHGDIDALSELEDYIKVAFQQNVGIPLPSWVRGPITDPAYRLSVNTVRKQYEIIGPTFYRGNATKQVDAVNQAMDKIGFPGKAYFGANFTHPFIHETLDKMRADGVSTILVFNKGAQFSYASSGENMDDVLKYLNEHKDWDVEVIGRFEYSEDPRFREVMAKAIEKDIKASFPGVPSKDVCVLLGSHGLPTWLTDRGDPAIRQMRRAVDWLKSRLPNYNLYHGFLNDDFFPGAQWVGPDAATVAEEIHGDGCPNVLLDGRLSFTTHHRATLYDMNYVARNTIEAPDLGPDGTPHPLWVKPKVVLAPNFDDDENFASLMANLAKEAYGREGDIVVLKESGKAALPNGSISTPGRFAEEFKKFSWPN